MLNITNITYVNIIMLNISRRLVCGLKPFVKLNVKPYPFINRSFHNTKYVQVIDDIGDVVEGTYNVASDVAVGTYNVASDVAVGTYNVASDITSNVIDGLSHTVNSVSGTSDSVYDFAESIELKESSGSIKKSSESINTMNIMYMIDTIDTVSDIMFYHRTQSQKDTITHFKNHTKLTLEEYILDKMKKHTQLPINLFITDYYLKTPNNAWNTFMQSPMYITSSVFFKSEEMYDIVRKHNLQNFFLGYIMEISNVPKLTVTPNEKHIQNDVLWNGNDEQKIHYVKKKIDKNNLFHIGFINKNA